MLRGSCYLSEVCDVHCWQGSSISCSVLTGHVRPLWALISTTYDSHLFRSNSDDGVDVLEKGPVRRQKSPHSDTTSRAANAIETLPRKPQNVLENGRKPAKTSELPAIIFTSAIVPRHNTENKEESSNTQQESRLGTQTKSNNKPETLVSNSPKRRRLCNDTDEAANERGQHHNAAESSSALKSSFSPPLMVSPDLNKYPSSTHERYLPSTPRTSLDAKKQNNTILWILMPSLSELVPLKLRSCMTMASLFDSVLAVCGLTGQQDKVSGLRATIHKLHDTIVPKPIILKRDLEDSFEVFLDVINAARCWAKEGGHCVVSLKVLMA